MRRTILGILLGLVLATPAGTAHAAIVSMEDLALLAASDLSNETILVFLDSRDIGFELDSETIARLRQQGVSDEVIRYLLTRTDARSDRDDRVVYASEGPYPPRYYYPYYGYEGYPYSGAVILEHWTHGYHRVGDHFFGGHHDGISIGHSESHGGLHYAGGGHLLGGHQLRDHSNGGHGGDRGGRSHLGFSRASHGGGGHLGGGRARGGHGGRGHGGGGHGGGGHGGGH